MFQQISIYVLLGVALFYLGYKFLIPKKKKNKSDGGCDNCN